MKRLIVILALFALVPYCLIAAGSEKNDSQGLLKLGRVWNYDRINADGSTDRVSLQLVGDTLLSGSVAFRLAYCTPEGTTIRYLLQEDWSSGTPCVFAYDLANNLHKSRFFNFNVEIGSDHSRHYAVQLDDGIQEQVLPGTLRLTDFMEKDGKQYRRYWFYNDQNAVVDCWLAGVGSYQSGILLADVSSTLVGDEELRFVSFCDSSDGRKVVAADFQLPRVGDVTYRKTIEDHKVWYCGSFSSQGDPNEHLSWTYQYYTDGDTIIGDRSCLKLYGNNHYSDGKRGEYLCAVFEEEGKVFFIEEGSTVERLLCDYALQAGDQLTVDFEQLRGTDGTATKLGESYFTLDDIWMHSHVFDRLRLIEGIGPTTGLLMPMLGGNRVGARFSLLLCTVNDAIIYDSHEVNRDDVLSISLHRNNGSAGYTAVYDLQGRRMQSDMVTKSQGNKVTRLQGNGLPKGIYIQNGRKFVVK